MKLPTPPQITLGLLSISAFIFAGMNSAHADQVFLDDLIVDGSACIGFDCVNGESFGFDTLRLKENNLRINFDDTSTSASFPDNDWRIVANDSSNGGGEYLGIEDSSGGRIPFRVEAGARSNALYVEDDGDIGIGTATPTVNLHVVDGNTPTLRLEQDGSSGFSPQTFDVAANEANFFVRDVTNGSTLPFRIQPGAGTNVLYLANDDQIGLGTTSPDSDLHVLGNVLIEDADTNTAATVPFEVRDAAGSGAQTLFSLANNGPCRMSMFDTTSGTGGDTQYLINVTNDEWRLSEQSTGVVEFKVDAAGNCTITGDFITDANTYPDYVFRPGYDLMPLEKLDAFIQKEGHLPNIPKEEQVKKEGLKMGDMQVRMLEKIEELTLYTLDQQKIIKELQERLDKVEGK